MVSFVSPALVALLVAANLGFASRCVYIAKRSSSYVISRELSTAAEDLPMLSIVVPARNEERQIEQCVLSLLAQEYPRFEVIVVDDRSEDATRAILERLAVGDARLRVVAGEALPQGWVGKPWALAQGAAVARGAWLLFTDADTTHEPASAAAAVAYAQENGLDVLSLLTKQVLVTAAERVFLPSILWTIGFAVGALRAINDPRSDAALFNGQYILMNRRAHEGIGGHAAVKGEIAEDFELAKRFKNDGRFHTALVSANNLVLTRMYRSFGEIWHGFVKNLALGARGQIAAAIAGVCCLAIVAPVTPLVTLFAVVTQDWRSAVMLFLSMIVAISGAEAGMRRFGLPSGSGAWLPVGMSVMVAIFCTSAVAHANGGVTWRGRRY